MSWLAVLYNIRRAAEHEFVMSAIEEDKKMDEKKEAKFLEVQTWFIIPSRLASEKDGKFYVVMSPEETIEYLQKVIDARKTETN